jgi:hypothetical protein
VRPGPVNVADIGIVRRQYEVMAPEHARFQLDHSETTRGMLGEADRIARIEHGELQLPDGDCGCDYKLGSGKVSTWRDSHG